MASNQTKNYSLNQWSLSDSVLMADFNADNQKLDSALATLNNRIDSAITDANQKVEAALAAATQKINAATQTLNTSIAAVSATIPHVQVGTYVGTGTSGPNHPNTLTFDFVPKVVIVNGIVEGGEGSSDNDHYDLIAIQGTKRTFALHTGSSKVRIPLSWDGCSLSWYSSSYYEQGNWKDAVYHYIAIG